MTRVLLILAVVAVFGAMWILDTAALVRLTTFCVTGGCGVRPLWIAIGAGAIVLAVVLSSRVSAAGRNITKAAKTGPSRRSGSRTAPRRKLKQAK